MKFKLLDVIGTVIGKILFIISIVFVGLPIFLYEIFRDALKEDDLLFAQVVVYGPLIIAALVF